MGNTNRPIVCRGTANGKKCGNAFYPVNDRGVMVGTCTNPHCSMYQITKSVDELVNGDIAAMEAINKTRSDQRPEIMNRNEDEVKQERNERRRRWLDSKK